MIVKIITIIFIIFFFTFPCFAEIYYVDQNNPHASDENPGTEDLPFLTISKSAGVVTAGDTVMVKEGIYREEIILERSGMDYTDMITFMVYPGDKVVIKGSDVATNWEEFKGHIWKIKNWQSNSQQVFCDGEILQQIAPSLSGDIYSYMKKEGEGLDDMKAGSFYYDKDNKILYVWLKDSSDPHEHLMEVSVRSFWFWIKDQNFVKISGFKMCHSSTEDNNLASFIINGSFNIIENNEVLWSDLIGSSILGSNNLILNNVFNYCGNSGITILNGSGSRFISNETSYNNYRNFDPGWHAGGIKAIPRVVSTVISGHIAHDNTGQGIWFDGWCSDITIEKCLLYNNSERGIFYEISERGIIKNNICYNNGKYGINISSSSDCGVYHNVVYGNGWEGISVVGAGREGVFGPEGKLELKNNCVMGNIMIDNGKPNNRPELNIEINTELAYNNISDYNIFWRTPEDGRKIEIWSDNGRKCYGKLYHWQKDTNLDKNSLFSDPRFVSLNDFDFHLQPDSPAIDLVIPVMSVTDDFNGSERPPYEARDAGVYNFVVEITRTEAICRKARTHRTGNPRHQLS